MDDQVENVNPQQTNPALDAAKDAAANATKKMAKKGIKRVVGNAVKTWLAPLMPWILGITLALIIIAGIIMFFVSGVGLIFDSLDAFSESFKNYWANTWYGIDANVKPYQVIQVADKLETMGYDLYGDGFVTETPEKSIADGLEDYREEIGQKIIENDVYWDEIAVFRDNYGITNINSTILKRYLISDNYIYTLYNRNPVWSTLFTETPADGFVVPRRGLIRLIAEKGSGFLSSTSQFGTFDRVYDSFSVEKVIGDTIKLKTGISWNDINVSINLNQKTLDVSTTSGFLFWYKTNTLSYSLEGWTGRYGMPLEFLLSLHLASEQPDLVMDILNSFETHVNVGLHKTPATFSAGIEISGQIVTLSDLEAVGKDDFIKTFYPSYYAEQQAQQAQDGGEDSDTTTEDTASETSSYQEELDGVLAGKSSTETGSDGQALYEVPVNSSQSINGAETVYISRDGTIYTRVSHEDGTTTYESTGVRYEIVREGQREYDITNEDEVILDYDEVVNALKAANDGNSSGEYSFSTLLPYIRNVDQHWFRDAYFLIGTDSKFKEDGAEKVVKLIKNDEDYEQTVGERWTLYETDSDGNYTLYLVTDSGHLGDRYNGTQEQAMQEDLRVSRKAITQLVSEKADEDETFREGMGSINPSLWTAYDLVGSGAVVDWTQWDEEQKDYPSGISDEIKSRLKYRITVGEQIVQKRDGERGETNSTIKKILTRYKYYTYDGSVERAKQINADRQEHEDFKHEDLGGNILDGTDEDKRNQNLVAKFSINADSLTAFKILENMNTLDADEIYRDFKELIVELNYFDKEYFGGKPTDEFQWLLPDTGTIGWPVREFSKNNNVFGTLIHSKVDLKNLYEVYESTVKRGDQGDVPTSPPSDTDDTTTTSLLNNTTTENLLGQMFLDQKESLESTQGKASNKMAATNSSGFSQSTFFDTAQACWDYIYAHGSAIDYGGMGACPFAQSPSSGSHKGTIDCSGFVTWVIYEWGTGEVKSHFSSQIPTNTMMKENYQDLFGWTEIHLSGSQDAKGMLQPGDIIVRDNGDGGPYGHTAIVKSVEGGTVKGWDCGDASRWRGSSNATETTLEGSFVSGGGREGKIIRIEDFLEIPAKKYEGYEGNTDVVSPVTGEIVEAGKITIQKNIETNETEEVGFIKIKVMTTEDYQALDIPKVDPKDISNLSRREKELAGLEYFYRDYKTAGVLGMYIYIEGFDVRITDENLKFKTDSTIMEDDEYVSKYRKHTYDDVIGEETRKVLENKEKLRDYAASTIEFEVGGQEKLFVKEGTVIGKTYTDGDLEEFSEVSEIDKDRAVVRPCVADGVTAEYPEMRFSNGQSPNWDEIDDDKKPTGNYIHVVLRTAEDGQVNEEANTAVSQSNTDKDNVIEDIEDYFELDVRNLDDECPMKLQETYIPEEVWVQCVVAYSTRRGADDIFKNSDEMHKFYRICVQNEMNPDFLFTRAIGESSLHSSTGNYWGWGVPNGAEDKEWGTWDETLEIICKGIVNAYVQPGGAQYRAILARYNERKAVTENGGIPRFGYGMPDTVPGVMSVYSWLGDSHYEGDAGSGGRYYLKPSSGTEIYTEDNYQRLCVEPHGSGPTTVWEQGSYTAHQVRGMLNLAHEVWPKYYPTEFHNELWY